MGAGCAFRRLLSEPGQAGGGLKRLPSTKRGSAQNLASGPRAVSPPARRTRPSLGKWRAEGGSGAPLHPSSPLRGSGFLVPRMCMPESHRDRAAHPGVTPVSRTISCKRPRILQPALGTQPAPPAAQRPRHLRTRAPAGPSDPRAPAAQRAPLLLRRRHPAAPRPPSAPSAPRGGEGGGTRIPAGLSPKRRKAGAEDGRGLREARGRALAERAPGWRPQALGRPLQPDGPRSQASLPYRRPAVSGWAAGMGSRGLSGGTGHGARRPGGRGAPAAPSVPSSPQPHGNPKFPHVQLGEAAPHTNLGRAVELAVASAASHPPGGWPQRAVRAGLCSWLPLRLESQIVVDVARSPPLLGGRRGGGLRSVRVGAARRVPRQTPGWRGASAGSDAPAPRCAAGGGSGPVSTPGPRGCSPKLRLLSPQAPPPYPFGPPSFGRCDLSEDKAGSRSSHCGEMTPLGPLVCICILFPPAHIHLQVPSPCPCPALR
jgi:hypothetical protein